MIRHELVAEMSQHRLDTFLAEKLPDLTRSHLQKLIAEGMVRVNATPARAGQKLHSGDRIEVEVPPPSPSHLEAEGISLTVAYEDADILVVDKPSGLAVHPGPGHPKGTLVNALLAHCPDLAGISGTLRPGIVHRLDKDTSGLMVVAKNDVAHAALAQQIKARGFVKGYLALVEGHLQPVQGTIEAPLGRDTVHRQRIAVVAGGREATTAYIVLEYLPRHTFLEVTPRTGRTHQIRVHLAAIGHPIYGDSVYGHPSPYLSRHFLHAHKLGFIHPRNGQYMELASSLPSELSLALERERQA